MAAGIFRRFWVEIGGVVINQRKGCKKVMNFWNERAISSYSSARHWHIVVRHRRDEFFHIMKQQICPIFSNTVAGIPLLRAGSGTFMHSIPVVYASHCSQSPSCTEEASLLSRVTCSASFRKYTTIHFWSTIVVRLFCHFQTFVMLFFYLVWQSQPFSVKVGGAAHFPCLSSHYYSSKPVSRSEDWYVPIPRLCIYANEQSTKHTIGAVPGYFWLLLTLKIVLRIIVASHVWVVFQIRKKRKLSNSRTAQQVVLHTFLQ